MAPQISLIEDEIDEILYVARANETTELSPYLESLTQKYNTSAPQILAAAIDPQSGNTALHFAGANGHLELTQLLLSTFTPTAPTPTGQDSTSTTPTIPDSLKSYINTINAQGSTALHFTSLNGHLDIVKILIGNGADASILNKAGYDCVFEAERNGKSEVVEWLLREAVGLEVGVRGITANGAGEGSSARREDEDMEEGDEEGEDISFTVRVGNTSGVMQEVDVAEGMEGLDVSSESKEKGKGPVDG